MKTFKRVVMTTFLSGMVIAFVGCGVSQEDHDKAVSELNETKSALAESKAKHAEKEKALKQAKAQLESAAKALETKEERFKVLEKTAVVGVDKAMKETLAAFEKEATDLKAQVRTLTGENSRLQQLLENLKAQFVELKQKLGGLQSSGGLPAKDLPTKDLPIQQSPTKDVTTDILKKKF